MADSYATPDDLKARYPSVGADATEDIMRAVLGDATDLIRTALGDATPSDATLRRVCCEVAARAIAGSSSGMLGATQGSTTVGPTSQSLTFSQGSGELYLTRAEKQSLGIGQAAFSVDMGGAS